MGFGRAHNLVANKFSSEYDVLLLEDDPYSALRYSGEAVPTIQQFAPDYVIYSSTFSKILAPGLRIGYSVAPQALSRWLVIAKQGADLHTQTFGQAMNSHAVKSEQIIDQKTNEMFQNIEKELAEYKEKKMGRIDTEVLTLIEKTYKEVLGKTLPPDIHRELILDALEKSKKEGLFTG